MDGLERVLQEDPLLRIGASPMSTAHVTALLDLQLVLWRVR